MPEPKPTADTRSQRQKFLDAAREHGADSDESTFRNAVRTVAKAPAQKAKKAVRKPKT